KQERVRARKLAEEATAAGDSSNLVKIMLSSIPPDGSEQTFSVNAAVQAAMQEGEAAFAKGDFDGAVEAYGRALALDPHTY
ncbi:tetratricopeptide repeat protein, partial [Klebsiella pneumoniae]|uniref:tetratricopeptide repeat protein n=1 Tax=Klebsiella pneumoniae TaxID=573 RepID=UPI0030141BCF